MVKVTGVPPSGGGCRHSGTPRPVEAYPEARFGWLGTLRLTFQTAAPRDGVLARTPGVQGPSHAVDTRATSTRPRCLLKMRRRTSPPQLSQRMYGE